MFVNISERIDSFRLEYLSILYANSGVYRLYFQAMPLERCKFQKRNYDLHSYIRGTFVELIEAFFWPQKPRFLHEKTKNLVQFYLGIMENYDRTRCR